MDVALDGIVGAVIGAVIGGGVAGWVLRQTIRHEAKQRDDVLAAARAEALEGEVQAFRRRIAEVYAELVRSLAGGAVSPQAELKAAVGIMQAELILLQLEARRLESDLEPRFAELRTLVDSLTPFAGGFVGREVYGVQESVCDALVLMLDSTVDW